MNDKYVKLADVKRKLRYIFKAYGVGSSVREKIERTLNNLPYSVKGDLETTLEAADVQSVKRGKWEETHISLVKYIPEDEKEEGHSFYMAELKCSCCERYNAVTFALTLNKPDFCQLCGARMDGDAEGRCKK